MMYTFARFLYQRTYLLESFVYLLTSLGAHTRLAKVEFMSS